MRNVVPSIIVADDHVMVAQGVARLLEESFRIREVVSSGKGLWCAIQKFKPDLVVSDVAMPDWTGIEVMRRARIAGERCPFVFVTMHADPELASIAMSSGASGFVIKSSAGDQLLEAARQALLGRAFVSPSLVAHLRVKPHPPRRITARQLEVLDLLAEGLRAKQVASRLGVSVRTVESHKLVLMHELAVTNVLDLVRAAESEGLTSRHEVESST